MKRALFAAAALTVAALAMPGAQAAGTDTAAKSHAGFFERLDANKDGAVSLDEMVAVRHVTFTKMDANGDGTVTRDEFMAYSAKPKPASAKSTDPKAADARKAKYFERLDADKNGSISTQEWDAVAQKQFASLDADKDGKVTKEEMAAARERFHSHRRGADAPAKSGDSQAN